MSLCGDVKTLVEAGRTRPLKILPNECLESSRWEFDLKNYVIIGGQPQRRRPSYCEVECLRIAVGLNNVKSTLSGPSIYSQYNPKPLPPFRSA